MTISVFVAAKALGEFSGWNLSNLKIQKILYIAHMFYMGNNEGAPLINDSFEAWDYGPVIPSLYHKLKIFGSDPVRDIFYDVFIRMNTKEIESIRLAAEAFSFVSPAKLVALTHSRGGAWDKNYYSGGKGIVIPNSDILAEYQKLPLGGKL